MLKGSYNAFFPFLNFSQCVVCMFGHKNIYKVTVESGAWFRG